LVSNKNMSNEKNKIIDKHIVFAEKYLYHKRNATLAYKAVYGYDLNDNTAAVNASKLLRTAKIQQYLREKFGIFELDSNYVLKNLKELAENGKSENIKLQALVTIGKYIGMFKDEQNGNPESLQEARSSYINYYVKNIMFAPYYSKKDKLS